MKVWGVGLQVRSLGFKKEGMLMGIWGVARPRLRFGV